MIKIDRKVITTLCLSATALVSIATMEGFKDKAYDDVVGVVTIGYGTTQGVKRGDKITPDKALVRLLNDIYGYEAAIKKCIHVPLYQYEYDSAVSFSYNIGSEAFCNSTMAKKWNAGDYKGGCEELSRWVYAGGVKVTGLVNRRSIEYKLCMNLQ